MSPPSPERLELSTQDLCNLLEERRKSAEAALWQLPGVSLAAQAFLLGAGLNPDAKPGAQVVVGGLGILAVVATAFVVLYQALRATTMGHWIERALGHSLAAEALAQTDIDLNPMQTGLLKVRNVFYFPWVVAGAAFLAADVYVLGRGLGLW